MTYYLKYRPQVLEDLDQDGVRESLKNIVKSGNIPHAILFSGPKGTGKTSAARILAKIVNCENLKKDGPCNECGQCIAISKGQSMDVIELDAASHRGIEDIRQIRDAVKLAPAKARKKVYIIDEAHMLTTEASNALLKTLEEPPEHVIFILATTNPEKLIDTIRSRVTNIVFKKATTAEISKSLGKIAKGEGIKVEDGVFEVIAASAGGSFRDATKVFEQLVSEGVELKKEKVEAVVSTRKSFNVDEFLLLLEKKDTKNAITMVDGALQKGAQARDIAGSIVENLRTLLLSAVGIGEEVSSDFKKAELVTLINLFSEAYTKVPYSFIEQMPLEIATIEWCESGQKRENVTKAAQGDNNAGEPVKAKVENKEALKLTNEIPVLKNETSAEATPEESANEIDRESTDQVVEHVELMADTLSADVWNRVLTSIRPSHASTEALLRAAKPLEFNGTTLKIGVYYKFHKEHLEEAHHRDILEKALESFLGSSVRVTCTLTEPPANKLPVAVDGEASKSSDEVILTEPKAETLGVKSSLTSTNGEDIINIAEKIFGN